MTITEPPAVLASPAYYASLVAEVDTAAQQLGPLIVHTAGWAESTDPEQQRLYQSAQTMIRALASIRLGVRLLAVASAAQEPTS